ncbi:hypothetical protein [Rhizobium leguminosarum]|uniref:hypothetical protein n=1 Tax=Rhizobium leguminosarum TaxID=384 RepID=UPI002E11787C|nr:hypothetical protein U8Q02_40615 [Rhizobium leguminosarum]
MPFETVCTLAPGHLSRAARRALWEGSVMQASLPDGVRAIRHGHGWEIVLDHAVDPSTAIQWSTIPRSLQTILNHALSGGVARISIDPRLTAASIEPSLPLYDIASDEEISEEVYVEGRVPNTDEIRDIVLRQTCREHPSVFEGWEAMVAIEDVAQKSGLCILAGEPTLARREDDRVFFWSFHGGYRSSVPAGTIHRR